MVPQPGPAVKKFLVAVVSRGGGQQLAEYNLRQMIKVLSTLQMGDRVRMERTQ